MAISMVNGYVCANCSDASLAKRGIDPAKADNLGEAQALSNAEKTGQSEIPEAVTEAAETERGRAKLDFSQVLDKLA